MIIDELLEEEASALDPGEHGLKIYTRSGDEGKTSLFGGQRVSKAHVRVRAYGSVDELNAVIGTASAALHDSELIKAMERVQSRLFDVGADLATPPESSASAHIERTRPEWVTELEAEIDLMESSLDPLRTFILPGGSAAAAALHLARTVCRRAERRLIIARDEGEDISVQALVFLNRLSDWLFVAARMANHRAGIDDIPWSPNRAAPDG